MYFFDTALLFILALCYLAVRGIFVFLRIKNKQHIHWVKEATGFLLAMYFFMVVSVTFFPWAAAGFSFGYLNMRSINLIPFVSIFEDISQIGTAYGGDKVFMASLIARNVGGNILLLMPLGFLAPVLSKKYRSFKKAAWLGLTVSLTIEILQLFQNLTGGLGRITDIDDVICNVMGTAIGYFLYALVIKSGAAFKIDMVKKLNA
ncbi:VanZ family protein [Bacillus sp. EB01]|uniref:VanZ family protein n=1 Tax=Bacillus sp. EB01 TaxID=1347086 RepID=UPI0005C67249|nr:VanZ family protein [Bacillus sp. EB01]